MVFDGGALPHCDRDDEEENVFSEQENNWSAGWDVLYRI